MEIWKDIEGYENLYQVSNYGRVRSVDRYVNYLRGGKRLMKGKIIKQTSTTLGYKQVKLCKDGKSKNNLIHRLVAESFIPNQYNLPEVNHIDENKSNNRVDNLEWVTHRYNVNYGTAQQRRVEKQKGKQLNRKDQSKPVLQYTFDGEFVAEYPSIHEAKRQTGITNISFCCSCKRKSAGGYIWKYKENVR